MSKANNANSYLFHAEYINDLRNGNSSAADHFVSYFRPRLRSFLRKKGAPIEDVEDLQQETMLRVLMAISSQGIRHPERFGGFVTAVCGNALMEQYRQRKRHIPAGDWMMEIPDTQQDPHVGLLKKEASNSVIRTISRLRARDRRVLSAVFLEQKSRADICEELRINKARLRLLIYRATRRFMSQMNPVKGRNINMNQCCSGKDDS